MWDGFAFPLDETLARIRHLRSSTGRSVLAGLRELNLTKARWPLADGLNTSSRALRDAVMEVRGGHQTTWQGRLVADFRWHSVDWF